MRSERRPAAPARRRAAGPLAALAGLALLAAEGRAAPRQDPTFNPQPADDDIVLPMPGGLEMAFRRIEVPGADFWFHPDREVRLGDVTSEDPHARDRVVRVMGSFQDERAQRWWYAIGKYEVSKAQFAAVVGEGDPAAGLARLAEASGDPKDRELARLEGRPRELRLAEPVRWIGWLAVQEFVHRYNRWLLSDPARSRSLPALVWQGAAGEKRLPGFLRLPSEIEWEYAARGGEAARRQGARVFERPLPFEPAGFERFAWLADNAQTRVRPIGTREPVFGLHDMLGNVAELVLDPFQAELGSGKIGALATRGGSAFTRLADLKTGARGELTLFQPDDSQPGRLVETRSPFVGFRLAIGAPVKPDAAYADLLRRSFEAYAQSFRANTGVATSGAASALLQSSVPIREIQEELARLRARAPQLAAELDGVRRRLERVEQLQDQEIRKVAGDVVAEATRAGATFARSHCRIVETREKVLPAAERLARGSSQFQAQLDDLVRQLAEREQLREDELQVFLERIRRIASYGARYAGDALERAAARQWPTHYESRAFAVVRRQVPAALGGRLDQAAARRELEQEAGRPPPGAAACV